MLILQKAKFLERKYGTIFEMNHSFSAK